MEIYSQIAVRIIKSQEAIIGPVAIEQAEHVPNLKIDWANHSVDITGDGTKVIDALVAKYKDLFGQISVEVSKDAAANLLSQLSPEKTPKVLQ